MKLKRDKISPPFGLCPFLFHAIYPYLLTLAHGGKFSWVRANEEVSVSCPYLKGVVAGICGNQKQIEVRIRNIYGECKYYPLKKYKLKINRLQINSRLEKIYQEFPYSKANFLNSARGCLLTDSGK